MARTPWFGRKKLVWAKDEAFGSHVFRVGAIASVAAALVQRFVFEGQVDWWAVMRFLLLLTLLWVALFVHYLWKVRHGIPHTNREISAVLAEFARNGENLRDTLASMVIKGKADPGLPLKLSPSISEWHHEVATYLRSEPRLGEGYFSRLLGRQNESDPPFPDGLHRWAADMWRALDRQSRHLHAFLAEFPPD